MIGAKIKRFLLNHVLECLILFLWMLAAILSDKFLTATNLLNILKNASMKGTLAVGMTIAIISGFMDLSISSTVSMTGIVIGLLFAKLPTAEPMALVLGIVIMIVVAACMASVHAFFVIKYNVPALIVTMATMKVLYCVAGLLCNGYPITTFPKWYGELGGGKIFGSFPSAGIWFIVAILFFTFLLKKTKTGRNIYATGGNLEAAHLSGINTNKIRWIAMFSVQCMAICAGIILSSQLRAGNHTYAQDWGLDMISSVIIGGASFAGGIGRVFGTVVGMLLVSTINNILTILDVSTFYQYLAQGSLILIAVVMNTVRDNQLAKMQKD
jgi:ribose/xylose/arabinose/galactoside ABC-type transport system permease subunit